MKIKLTGYRQASVNEISQAEEQIGVVFPSDYKEFLRRYDGSEVEDNVFADNLDIGIRSFIPVSKLADEMSSIEGLPNDVWPIAEDSNGNYIYIRKDDYSVYFWDHEVEGGDKRLAASFGEFIDGLQPYDPATAPLPPHRVVSSWVDPNFKPEF